jgi:hypothetical protein
MIETAESLFEKPIESANHHFVYNFKFLKPNSGIVTVTYLNSEKEKVYPFTVFLQDGEEFMTIEYIHTTSNGVKQDIGLTKSVGAMAEFLFLLQDVDYALRSRNESLKEAIELLSNPITSTNKNITVTFNFIQDNSGNFEISDNRTNQNSTGDFNLVFSEERYLWHLELTSDIKVRNNNGTIGLMSCDINLFVGYLDRISY